MSFSKNAKPLLELHNESSVHGRFNNVGNNHDSLYNSEVWALETGLVTEVYSDYTCRVSTTTGRDLLRVPYATSWYSYSNGCGIYMHPEADSRVILGRDCFGCWYILGFLPYHLFEADEISFLNGKRDLQQGDICASTAAGNYIEIRKFAGTITLHNTEICKIIMDSKENQIFIHSQRLYILNAAGLIQMTTDTKGNTVTVGYFRKQLDDTKNFVKVLMGSTGLIDESKNSIAEDGTMSSPSIMLSVNISNKASLTVDTEGNVKTYCNSYEGQVELDHTLMANGIITDKSAKDIVHRRMSPMNMTGVQDPEIESLGQYDPGLGNKTPAVTSADQEIFSPSTSAPPNAAQTVTEDPSPADPPNEDELQEKMYLMAKVNKTFTHRKGGVGHIGTLTVYKESGEATGTYMFRCGPFGSGAIPPGIYSVGPSINTNEIGMVVKDPNSGSVSGWKFPVENMWDPNAGRIREGIRIHPDGNWAGTKGCVGISGDVTTLEDCRAKISEAIKLGGGSCKMKYIGPNAPSSGRLGPKGIQLIQGYEKFRPEAYLDAVGVWTIGYGHTGSVDGVPIHKGMVISEEKVNELFKQDMRKFEQAVERYVKVPLNQEQFDALVSFTFNVGAGALSRSTALRKINSGDYEGGAEAMKLFNKGTVNGKKVVLRGLARRRNSEAHLFTTGELNFFE